MSDLLPVGTEVRKKSGKPFKNGEKADIIARHVAEHPYRPDVPAYWLRDSECYVEAWRCEENAPQETEEAITALGITKVLEKKRHRLRGESKVGMVQAQRGRDWLVDIKRGGTFVWAFGSTWQEAYAQAVRKLRDVYEERIADAQKALDQLREDCQHD